uniref:PPDK_N domain-containing protein n=1 Tax=Globodera pallida TaxID=36090 RepID=A0A183BTW7_GLOPA
MINTTQREEGGLDFLAATHEVRSLKKRLVSHARFEVHRDEFGRSTLLCANIREVLLHRVETLWKNGKLTENFDGKLLITILGDRGCGSVKIGLQIGNVLSDANSPRNFTLVAFWEGDHMRRLLRASEEIRSIGTLFASDTADLLIDVRELPTYARAVLMTPQQIHNFEAKCFAVHSYFRVKMKTFWKESYGPSKLAKNSASFHLDPEIAVDSKTFRFEIVDLLWRHENRSGVRVKFPHVNEQVCGV